MSLSMEKKNFILIALFALISVSFAMPMVRADEDSVTGGPHGHPSKFVPFDPNADTDPEDVQMQQDPSAVPGGGGGQHHPAGPAQTTGVGGVSAPGVANNNPANPSNGTSPADGGTNPNSSNGQGPIPGTAPGNASNGSPTNNGNPGNANPSPGNNNGSSTAANPGTGNSSPANPSPGNTQPGNNNLSNPTGAANPSANPGSRGTSPGTAGNNNGSANPSSGNANTNSNSGNANPSSNSGSHGTSPGNAANNGSSNTANPNTAGNASPGNNHSSNPSGVANPSSNQASHGTSPATAGNNNGSNNNSNSGSHGTNSSTVGNNSPGNNTSGNNSPGNNNSSNPNGVANPSSNQASHGTSPATAGNNNGSNNNSNGSANPSSNSHGTSASTNGVASPNNPVSHGTTPGMANTFSPTDNNGSSAVSNPNTPWAGNNTSRTTSANGGKPIALVPVPASSNTANATSSAGGKPIQQNANAANNSANHASTNAPASPLVPVPNSAANSANPPVMVLVPGVATNGGKPVQNAQATQNAQASQNGGKPGAKGIAGNGTAPLTPVTNGSEVNGVGGVSGSTTTNGVVGTSGTAGTGVPTGTSAASTATGSAPATSTTNGAGTGTTQIGNATPRVGVSSPVALNLTNADSDLLLQNSVLASATLPLNAIKLPAPKLGAGASSTSTAGIVPKVGSAAPVTHNALATTTGTSAASTAGASTNAAPAADPKLDDTPTKSNPGAGPCENQALNSIYATLLSDKNNVLGTMFELTAMRLAKRALEQQSESSTLEDLASKNIALMDNELKQLDSNAAVQKQVMDTYETFGKASDLKQVSDLIPAIKAEINDEKSRANDACYFVKNGVKRLNNTQTSAFIMAAVTGEKDSGLSDVDAATTWVFEKFRQSAATTDKRFQIGHPQGNLMNMSTRVARYLGLIKDGRNMTTTQMTAMITQQEGLYQDSLKSAIAKGYAKVEQTLDTCLLAHNQQCVNCKNASVKNFETKNLDFAAIQRGLLEKVAKAENATVQANLKGQIGSDITLDFSNFARDKDKLADEASVPSRFPRTKNDVCSQNAWAKGKKAKVSAPSDNDSDDSETAVAPAAPAADPAATRAMQGPVMPPMTAPAPPSVSLAPSAETSAQVPAQASIDSQLSMNATGNKQKPSPLVPMPQTSIQSVKPPLAARTVASAPISLQSALQDVHKPENVGKPVAYGKCTVMVVSNAASATPFTATIQYPDSRSQEGGPPSNSDENNFASADKMDSDLLKSADVVSRCGLK
jgi:hypothetical protein